MKAEHARRQWVEGCATGKRGFIARAGAKDAARAVAKSGNPGLRPYRCPACEYWHIGHKPEPVVRSELTSDEWYGR